MIELHRNPRQTHSVDIKVIGIGGAGSNALDRIVLDGIDGAAMVAMNTDVQALTGSVATRKVQLGRSATRGLGAGGDPEVGAEAAEESVEEIQAEVEDASLVIVLAGLGGGTGSGSAPLVARLAKEQGALVVVVATMPFSFEGKRRRRQADDSLSVLQQIADVVLCFENDRMGEAGSPKDGIHQAFANADQTLSQSVRAVCDLIRRPGLVDIGFDELRAALCDTRSRALFGSGQADGENRAHLALERALKSPLMERGRLLNEGHDVLVQVSGGADMTLGEVQALMDELGRHLDDDARILFGVAVDAKLGAKISVTILSSAAAQSGSAAAAPPPASPARVQPPRPAPIQVYEPEPEPEQAGAEEAGEVEQDFEEEPEVVAESEELLEPVEAAVGAEDESLLELDLAAAAAESQRHHEEPASEIRFEPAHEERPVAGKPGRIVQERQETLQFEPVSRGRFEKSEPTIIDGEDLDVPTFLRRNVRLK